MFGAKRPNGWRDLGSVLTGKDDEESEAEQGLPPDELIQEILTQYFDEEARFYRSRPAGRRLTAPG